MGEKEFLHKVWSEMPTAQLDEVLQQELRKENPTEEVVLGIMRIIQEREEDCPVEITEEIHDAWEQYSKKTATPKKTNQKRMWFVSAVAAAVICIVILAIPQKVGAESILDAFFRWTESVFEFFTPAQDATNPPVEYVFQTDNPGLQQLYDKVTELGVTEPIVPMWVPEGYALTELKTTQMPNGSKVHATLQLNNSSITLSYRISVEIMPILYEKEMSSVEAYEASDVHHFIMDNDENILVTWIVNGAECSISTDLEKEDVYNMIRSIYRRELS